MKGNTTIEDKEILEAVLLNKSIDVNNVAFDFAPSNQFTWDYKSLVEIKKRKRKVTRYYRPNAKVIQRVVSARSFDRAKLNGAVREQKSVVQGY